MFLEEENRIKLNLKYRYYLGNLIDIVKDSSFHFVSLRMTVICVFEFFNDIDGWD